MAKFEKGKSGNPNGRPPKNTGRVEYGFAASQTMPDMPAPVSDKKLKTTQAKYIAWGTDNLFPNLLAELNRKAPIHRGIINWATIYTSGNGFVTSEKNSKLIEFINSCNQKKESLKKVIRKAIFDKKSSGNAFLELVISGGVLQIYHKDYTECRISIDRKSVLIYGDWENFSNNYNDVKTIGLFPEWTNAEKGVKRSIVQVKDYEPGFKDYGVASWISAMDAAGIAYKTNKWNLSRLDNSFSSSGVLVIEGNISPTEAKKMKNDFKAEFTGENKQGKVMFVVKQVGGGETKFTPLATNQEGDWEGLHKQSKEDLINAHNWFPSLCGAAYQTGFDTARARLEYQIAINTVIKEEQITWTELLSQILSEYGKYDVSDFGFDNQLPFSIQDLLDPKLVLTIDEQRNIFGYTELEDGSGKSRLTNVGQQKTGGQNG